MKHFVDLTGSDDDFQVVKRRKTGNNNELIKVIDTKQLNESNVSNESNEVISIVSAASNSITASLDSEPVLYKSYYQRAFLSIIEAVLDVYSPILEEEEVKLFTQIVKELEFYPQRLLVRLFLRRAGWLRAGKLDYEDIVNVPGCLTVLEKVGLVQSGSETLFDYVDLLTIPELKTLANRLGRTVSNANNRDSLIESIITPPAKGQRRICFSAGGKMALANIDDAIEQARRLAGNIIQMRPEIRRALDLAISLYFLVSNDSTAVQESLSTAILNEINRRKYPRYVIKRSGPIFRTRSEFGDYQRALEEEAAIDDAVIDEPFIVAFEEKFAEALKQTANRSYFLKRYSAGWIYCRILSSIASALEAAKEYPRALLIYQRLLAQTEFCLGRRGKWWERIVLDASRHLKNPALALKLCQQSLGDPLVRTSARISLQRRLRKLADHEDLNAVEDEQPEIVSLIGRIQAGNVTGRKVKLHLNDDDLELGSVESFVLSEFQKRGWNGIHCESSFFTTLFGLLFWDILFVIAEEDSLGEVSNSQLQRNIVEDVFQTAYQNAPLDLQSDAFYPSRQSIIEARLHLIQSDFETIIKMLKRNHMNYHQQSCVGVDWESFGGEEGIALLVQVCQLIGPMALSSILRQFAEDYRHHRSGLPDLLLWRRGSVVEEDELIPNANGVVFAEVKSPNDRMSDAQRYWFSILKSCGMRVVLVQVKNSINSQ